MTAISLQNYYLRFWQTQGGWRALKLWNWMFSSSGNNLGRNLLIWARYKEPFPYGRILLFWVFQINQLHIPKTSVHCWSACEILKISTDIFYLNQLHFIRFAEENVVKSRILKYFCNVTWYGGPQSRFVLVYSGKVPRHLFIWWRKRVLLRKGNGVVEMDLFQKHSNP